MTDRFCVPEGLLGSCFRVIPEYVFVKNLQLQYVAASDVFARQMGYSCAEDVLGKTDSQLIADQALAQSYENMDRRLLATGENIIDAQECSYDKMDRVFYRSTSKYLIRDSSGAPMGIYGRVQDVTKAVIAEYRYGQEISALLDQTAQDCYTAVIDLNEWKIVSTKVNPRYEDIMPQVTDLDSLLGIIRGKEDHGEISEFYNNFSFEFFSRMYQQGRDYFSFKYFHRLQQEQCLWIKDSVWIRINPADSHLMIFLRLRSIDEKKRKELELRRAAELDGLTGVLNRQFAKQLICKLLEEDRGEDQYSAFMVDVDNFKTVNDTCGHQIGDQVLVKVAELLKESFREGDIICRIGGDEFFALVKHGPEGMDAEARAAKILDRISQEQVPGSQIHISASVGICDYPRDGRTLDELYFSADSALYQAKKNGKNQYFTWGK